MIRRLLLLLAIAGMAHATGTLYIFLEGTSFGVSVSFFPLIKKDLVSLGYTVYDNTGGGRQICNNADCAYVTAIAGSSVGTWNGSVCPDPVSTTVCRAPAIDDPYFAAHPGATLIFWQDGPTNDVSAIAGYETTLETRIVDLFARRAPACATSLSTCVFITSTIVARAWPSGNYSVYDTVRLNWNALIRSACGGTALTTNANGGAVYRCAAGSPVHYLVDVAADDRMGDPGDENSVYFNSDHVHPSPTGNGDVYNPLVEYTFINALTIGGVATTAPLTNGLRR